MDMSFFRSHTSQMFRAQGVTRGILRVLHVRGIEVSEEMRERIEECDDPDLAAMWIERALTAGRAEDIFEDSAA